MLTNNEQSYGLVSRGLHGLLMLMIFVMLGVGLYMTELDKTDDLRKQLYALHKSTGVMIFMLVVVRILWLKLSPGPALPSALANWEKILTTVVKSLLYLLMLAIPLSGVLMSNSKGYPVNVYGLFELPMLVGENEGLHEIMEELHGFFAYSLLFLVLLHAAGALKHRFLDTGPNIDVMKRMFGKV